MTRIATLTFAALLTISAEPLYADAAMVDVKLNMYDADYEITIAEYGYVVGSTVYGIYDADYDVHLSNADLFKPLLGHYDADYEAVLMPTSAFATEMASR